MMEAAIRERIQQLVQELVHEELNQALGVGPHERGDGRRGYRHGHLPLREVATSHGVVSLEVPRARMFTSTGSEEYRSQLVPRYVRRSKRVDAALLSCYLTGTNTRKVRLALRPLLDGTPMSKSVVSRVAQKLAGEFEAWRSRDLSGSTYAMLIMDAIRLPVRLARRVVKVPVLVVLGVRENGARELLDLRVAPSESTDAWTGQVESLVKRNLACPRLVIVDGNRGLLRSIETHWPKAKVQRCCQHKHENMKSHCPKHAHAELKRDYRAITHAPDAVQAKSAYDAFCRKWEKLVPEVAKSLKEAGPQLLTFYQFPKAMWKSLRTTNGIERLNLEFRRRTKTQGSYPTEAAALHLLFGLLASGVIRLRKIDGHRSVANLMAQDWSLAA